MRYLITGHTGFKGSWLSAMLKIQGHEVYGIALNPAEKSLFRQANISKYLDKDIRLDIRNKLELLEKIEEINPDVIIHLAAQPLVRASYSDPVSTFEINVIGTLNVLESTRKIENLAGTLIITTDKVYKNKNQIKGYVETDELGGDDPYSSSKAAADLATQSWRKSFGKSPISIGRAGNVIGGGDWAEDRIITDLVHAILAQSKLVLRNPKSIRPWQHVLDCLNGYLKLIEEQLNSKIQGEWNFGPQELEFKSVEDLVMSFTNSWGFLPKIEVVKSEFSESNILVLNSEKSRDQLHWQEKLNFDEVIDWTTSWYKSKDPQAVTENQIIKYLNM